ncbi:MAG: hypothetical protein AB7O28_02765 [Vicinamibacterales bacterium]
MPDPLMQALSALPCARVDPARSARIRQRCHDALARQTAHAGVRRRAWPFAALGRAWRPAMALLGVAYLAEVIRVALAAYSVH